jgi:hypothetical protein
MLLIRMTTLSSRNNSGGSTDKMQSGWRQRLWVPFIDWLTEPIPFPGKVYHLGHSGESKRRALKQDESACRGK